MTEIMMVALAPYDVGQRQVFNTGVSTVGKGGHDYYCGHCGRQMAHSIDFSRIEADLVYQCGACGGHNVPPAAEG